MNKFCKLLGALAAVSFGAAAFTASAQEITGAGAT
ncbi:MAG: hypothetical protein RL341_770, partial [Pseudomonadota bacterium]